MQEQYVFIYKALAEWVQFGETDMDVSRVHDHCRHLNQPASQTPTGNTLRSAQSLPQLAVHSPPPAGANRMFMEFKVCTRV
jgi:hypothetical protein